MRRVRSDAPRVEIVRASPVRRNVYWSNMTRQVWDALNDAPSIAGPWVAPGFDVWRWS
jgi:hypothetical protein